MKNNKWGMAFVLAVIAGFVGYLIKTNKLELVMHQITHLDYKWFGASILAIVLYWVLEAKMVNNIVLSMGGNQSFWQAFQVTMVGQFFSGITPFASGGQPMQLYIMSAKQKFPVGKGTSALMSKFIVYQGTLVVYALVLLLFKSKFFIENINNLFAIVIVGFAVNAVVIGALILLSTSKRFNKGFIRKIVYLLHQLKIVRHPEERIAKLEKHIEEFHENVIALSENKLLLFNTIALTVVQLTLYFMVPYLLYRSFGLEGAGLVNMLSATAFVLMITSFIPIPGASGGAEGGFYLMFGLFFIGKYIMTAIVLWRVLTYYIWILFGGMFMIFSNFEKRLC